MRAVTVRLDLTLRDLQNKFQEERLPWEVCKSFDASAPIGTLVPISKDINLNNIPFSLKLNGEVRQKSNTSEMILNAQECIAYLSTIWTLIPGDIIFTGMPVGLGSLKPGDKITLESPLIGSLNWGIQNLT